MEFRKITAIVRHSMHDAIEQRLLEEGIRGLSCMDVYGCGEAVDVFQREGVRHCRFEIYTTAERAPAIARAIAEAAHTGVAGDGLVAVEPVLSVLRVKSGGPADAQDLHH